MQRYIEHFDIGGDFPSEIINRLESQFRSMSRAVKGPSEAAASEGQMSCATASDVGTGLINNPGNR